MIRGVAACLLAIAVIPAAAQSPVVNAVVERRAASADFARDVQSAAARPMPAWIGYRVPIARRADAGLAATARAHNQKAILPNVEPRRVTC